MTRMIIVRHGESTGNLDKRFYGHFDGLLTDKGRQQAALAAEYLKDTHIDAAVGSDLLRAYETGAIIAAPHGLTVKPEQGLREIYAGEWENQIFDELSELYKEDYHVWMTDLGNAQPTGGESVRALSERINETMWRLAAEYDGKTLLVATHATPIRTLICRWQHQPIEAIQEIGWVKNASVSIVDYDIKTHETAVQILGEAAFLGDLATSLPKNV